MSKELKLPDELKTAILDKMNRIIKLKEQHPLQIQEVEKEIFNFLNLVDHTPREVLSKLVNYEIFEGVIRDLLRNNVKVPLKLQCHLEITNLLENKISLILKEVEDLKANPEKIKSDKKEDIEFALRQLLDIVNKTEGGMNKSQKYFELKEGIEFLKSTGVTVPLSLQKHFPESRERSNAIIRPKP